MSTNGSGRFPAPGRPKMNTKIDPVDIHDPPLGQSTEFSAQATSAARGVNAQSDMPHQDILPSEDEELLDLGMIMAKKILQNVYVYWTSMLTDILTTFVFLYTGYRLMNSDAPLEIQIVMIFIMIVLAVISAFAEKGVIASSAACQSISRRYRKGMARNISLNAARWLLAVSWLLLVFNIYATFDNVAKIFPDPRVGIPVGIIFSLALTAYHYVYSALEAIDKK